MTGAVGCGSDQPEAGGSTNASKRATAAAPVETESAETNRLSMAAPVFLSAPGQGRDPFFPSSQRRQDAVEEATEELQLSAGVLTNLTLQSILGGRRPVATINNRVFVEGETGGIALANGDRVEMTVIEIEPNSHVVIILEKLPGEHTLQLPAYLRR